MKTAFCAVALGLVATATGGTAWADSPSKIDTLNCTRLNDGSTVTDDVYAYTLDADQNTTRYLSVYLAGNKFAPWAFEEYFGSNLFAYCSLSGVSSIKLVYSKVVDVTNSGVGKHVDAGVLSEDSIKQRYTLVTISYQSIGIDALSTPQTAPAPKEEQQKSLEAFHARGLAIPH